VTINADSEGNPFEVFINVGKAGSDITADAEALGRLVSLALRIPSGYSPKEVARQIVNQLTGIGGSSQRGFGIDRVYSLADAIAKVLSEYLAEQGLKPISEVGENGNGNGKSAAEKEKEKAAEIREPVIEQPVLAAKSVKVETRRDICPKCGVAAFVYEEGCKKCYSCGNSEC
jgi:ribonucleoside-diphosphate reductase alpha chain